MNTLKTFFLLMMLTGLLLLIGAYFGGEMGIVIAVVLAVIMNFGAYWFSDRIALGMAHAKQITAEDDPELFALVAEQAQLANMPMPKVYEIDTDSPNAFATGRNPQHTTVAVTTGIRRILTREELAGVMAHEMAHVGNRDTLIMAVVATIAGAISMLALMAQFAAIFGGMGGADATAAATSSACLSSPSSCRWPPPSSGWQSPAPANFRLTPPEPITAAIRRPWRVLWRNWSWARRFAP